MPIPRPASLAAAALLIAFAACGKAPPPPTVEPTPAVDRPAPPTVEAHADAYFVDVAGSAGLTTVTLGGGPDKDHNLESVGTGAAFVDFDEDGRLDIFIVNAWTLDEEPSRVRVKGRNALYRNNGDGTFSDVADRVGVVDDGWGCGVCVGDFDNDGHVDLYVTHFGPNRLYRNQGDGTFEQVAEQAGVADPGWGAGAAFFDADNDGDLDLYVANYINAAMDDVLNARRTTTWRETVKVLDGPFGFRGGRDKFYRNLGDGTFRDATDEAGMTDTAESYGLGVLAADLDLDGDIDLFVANDSCPNFLYRNNGDGTFTEVGTWSGAGVNGHGVAQAGMGVDAADFDGDGLPDILVTTFAQDSVSLYRNEGGLMFRDVSPEIRLPAITRNALKWGCAFLDFDHDADVDIAIANGHIYPQVDQAPSLNESYRQTPFFLRNDAGRLTDVSTSSGPGLRRAISGRGLAIGDYDDDGNLDLIITGMDEPPMLLRNDAKPVGGWLKLRLLNRHGSPAFGARAVMTAGGKAQSRELRGGGSHQSQHAPELHFGLGPASVVESVTIRWLDGRETILNDVAPNRTITTREP